VQHLFFDVQHLFFDVQHFLMRGFLLRAVR
jgi:hypothetical protein